MLSFAKAVSICVRQKPFSVKGRACRSEFWWFMLALILTEIALVFVIMLLPQIGPLLGGAFFIVSTVLSITVSVRRLHDLNLSGWWILVLFVLNFAGGFGAAAGAAVVQFTGGLSLIALIVFIVLFCRRGTVGWNRLAPIRWSRAAGHGTARAMANGTSREQGRSMTIPTAAAGSSQITASRSSRAKTQSSTFNLFSEAAFAAFFS